MPHLRLEYSANLDTPRSFAALFAQLHGILQDTAGIAPDKCKSRALRCEQFAVGGGSPERAFVHLELRVFAGKPPELIDRLGRRCLQCVRAHFAVADSAKPLQITVAIDPLATERYFKYEQ